MKRLFLIILISLFCASNSYEKPNFRIFHKKHHIFKEKSDSQIKLTPYYGDDGSIHNDYNRKNLRSGAYRKPGYQIRYKHGLTRSKHYFYFFDYRTQKSRKYLRIKLKF